MTKLRRFKPQPVGHSILKEMLALHLQQLEIENGGMEAFLPKTGLARGTYYTMLRGIGNPTLKTMERIASRLNMTVFELLGFEIDDARRALKKRGVDYDELTSAIRKKDETTRRIARKTRSQKLSG
ncbi:XRE family transcriptional regulator [Mesorhizobium shangrilense]|uniref:XRE family transcriptional regulator n=1 Tax=Mesorhizobium shangrilense TaxID=460060 RepID=A0ABV2DQ58_9HYPH